MSKLKCGCSPFQEAMLMLDAQAFKWPKTLLSFFMRLPQRLAETLLLY